MSDLPPGFVLDKGTAPAADLPPGFVLDAPKAAPDTGSTASALWDGLMHGAGNILYGGERLLARAVPGNEAGIKKVDQDTREREAAYRGPFAPGQGQLSQARSRPIASGIGEFAGEALATAPLAVGRGATLAGQTLWGMLGGGAGGALGAASSARPESFGRDVGVGTALGSGVGGAIGAGGAMLRPRALETPKLGAAAAGSAPAGPPQSWREAADMLTERGVNLSPGQVRNMSEMERSMQTWPILRGLVKGQVGRSVDDFNRATVAQALEPIAAIVPRSVSAGHNLMNFAKGKMDAAYDRVLPNLSLTRDGVISRIQTDPELAQLFREMAPADATRFSEIVKGRILSSGKYDAAGDMSGRVFKKVESDLSNLADGMAGGTNDGIARGIRHMLSTLRDELALQNPRFAPELQKVNDAFSMFARVRAASVRNADGKARFTPHDLLQALKSEDPSSGGGSFSRGHAPMQAFAEAGQEVIGPSLLNRAFEPSKSFWRAVGDTSAGAVGAIPYAVLGGGSAPRGGLMGGRSIPGVQDIPGLGQLGRLAPSVGADVGQRSQRSQRRPSPHDVTPPPGPR